MRNPASVVFYNTLRTNDMAFIWVIGHFLVAGGGIMVLGCRGRRAGLADVSGAENQRHEVPRRKWNGGS